MSAAPKTWTEIDDKHKWGEGPWADEPDVAYWVDEETELRCIAVRDLSLGHWTGYVGVPSGHPLYRVDDDDRFRALAVHGGVDSVGGCAEGGPERDTALGVSTGHIEHDGNPVCHATEPGDVWWLGFRADGVYDVAPKFEQQMRERDMALPPQHTPRVYRSLGYMRDQCEGLAAQLATIGAEATA